MGIIYGHFWAQYSIQHFTPRTVFSLPMTLQYETFKYLQKVNVYTDSVTKLTFLTD